MTLRLVSVLLSVASSAGTATYETRFAGGLNVLNARNTWGKSTLIQSIVYALGLEGSQSASRRSPLGPAMTTVVETSRGRSAVSESYVSLTLQNAHGQYLRVRRWGLSGDVDRGLVQVWQAPNEALLGTVQRRDMFVREPGSTTSDVGFHRLLAEFLGWTLPTVPNFAGGESRLYLEVIFPLFYVEQKFGWSGVAPRIPTHYGIREPLRRSAEYVLGLSTLARLRARESLREEESQLVRNWSAMVARAQGAAVTENFRIVLMNEYPVSVANRRSSLIEVYDTGEWLSITAAEDRWRHRLMDFAAVTTLAGERTDQSKAQLAEAEKEAQHLGAELRATSEQFSMSRADREMIDSRLQSIEADRKQLLDVKRIERLGGELELPLLSEGRCPTCSQSVDNRDVATNTVSSVDENIKYLDAERQALLSMRESADQRTAVFNRSVAVAEAALSQARDRIRLLRDELAGPSNAPSLAEVQERLRLEERLRAAARITDIVGSVEEILDDLAQGLEDIRSRRASLDSELGAPEDEVTLRRFRTSFQEQLASYSLRSLSPQDVTIDEKTLLPVHDGFELTFDIAMGMSASDMIRTKWAYHTALLEAAVSSASGHHMKLLMLDEPRQQETDRNSLKAFLERLGRDSEHAQIVYATSEDPEVLSRLLTGIPFYLLPAGGEHLIDIRG